MASTTLDHSLPCRFLATVLALALLSGCVTSSTRIPPPEVFRLSAMLPVEGESTWVQTIDGPPEKVEGQFSVKLVPRVDLPSEQKLPKSALRAFQSPFIAKTDGTMLLIQGDGQTEPTLVPLASLREIHVHQFSAGRTAAVVGGAMVGAGLLITTFVLLFQGATNSGGFK